MKTLTTLKVSVTALTIGAVSLLSPVIFAAETIASDCIATDVKGHLNYSGNHLSGNPITGFFENIATNADCPDDVFVHIFGSNIAPESDGWFDSQSHVATHPFSIPQGSSQNIEVSVPQSDYCWYQVDATRTSEVRTPPVYHGNDMIDYVFVKNAACDVTPTPSATPSATPTATPSAAPSDTPTPTPGNNNNGGGGSSTNSGTSTSSTTTTEPAKTVAGVQAALGTTTMAGTGNFAQMVMNGAFITGMIVSALGAISYAKDKKSSSSAF